MRECHGGRPRLPPRRGAAQARELTRLGGQLDALRRTLTVSLALAEELQAGTIEKILAKDDVELAMEYLLGKRKP